MVSTHEIDLLMAYSDSDVLTVRSCQWNGEGAVSWDSRKITQDSIISENIRHDILSGRRRILFVESKSQSLDPPMCSALFPKVQVISKNGCEEVRKVVTGVRGTEDQHHVKAYGFTDRNARCCRNVKILQNAGVFTLDVFSVELLHYCGDAIDGVTCRHARGLGESEQEKKIGPCSPHLML